MSNIKRTVLVTGSNRGIGLQAAIQFALLGGAKSFDKILITSRDAEKGAEALAEVVQRSGKPHPLFQVIEVDLTDHVSVKKAVEELPSAGLEVVVLNAGGLLGETVTKHGVTENMGANVVGHAVLIEGLIAKGKLANGSRVIFSHSETTRSVWPFTGLQPFVRLYKEEMEESMVRPPTRGVFGIGARQRMNTYANSKLIGGLYFSALAREHPEIYFVSVSPGGCDETDVYSSAPQPLPFLMSLSLLKWGMRSLLGVVHSSWSAASRYVRAATDDNFVRQFPSGSVVGGPYFRISDASGCLTDQARFSDHYMDRDLQEEALRIVRKAAAA